MKKLRITTAVLLIFTLTTLLTGCVATLPLPEIREGRFDFSVTYEIDGEEHTYTGVYVCEYDGVLTTFLGSYVEWKSYVENEENEDVAIQTNEDGVVYINFGFFPEYFMDDPLSYMYATPTPGLYMIYNDSTDEHFHITSEEEDIVKYGVRLISFEYPEPIKNTFKKGVSFSRFEPSIN